MEYFRITKYNHEKFGTSEYKNDWTSVWDVGKIFNGKALTPDIYMETENKYIYILNEFMKANNIFEFNLKGLELKDYKNDLKELALRGIGNITDEFVDSIFKTERVKGIDNINQISRMILREAVWCKLENENMFVHFGYDYYMYVGCKNKINENRYREGIYIEPFKSPYLDY